MAQQRIHSFAVRAHADSPCGALVAHLQNSSPGWLRIKLSACLGYTADAMDGSAPSIAHRFAARQRA